MARSPMSGMMIGCFRMSSYDTFESEASGWVSRMTAYTLKGMQGRDSIPS